MTHIKRFVLLTILAGVLAGTSLTSPAHAQIAPQTCDSDVWMTMEMRARLETEREIMQNQNLIFKPDSILNYMCFDAFAGHAAHYVGELFTHTAYWGALIIPWGAPFGMDHAMTNVIIRSMTTYLDSNFDHSPLGGRAEYLGMQRPVIRQVITPGDEYACAVMAQVWQLAKCMNFMHTPAFANTDGYYPFRDLTAGPGGSSNVLGYQGKTDIRHYPASMNCLGGPPPIPGGWSEAYGISKNEADILYDYHIPNQLTFDEIRLLVEPGVCSAPVDTGITVILSPASTSGLPDGVCTNPGCTYVGGGCSASGGIAGAVLRPSAAAPPGGTPMTGPQ